VQFRYDALGRRVARRVVGDPSASTRSFFDGWRLIEEQNESGRAVATYVHGPGMNDVLSVRRGHRDLFLHKDDLQTVLAVTDDTGRRIESYAYDDFGAPSIGDARGTPLSASAIGNPHLFGGHVYDPDLGLYDCRTRFFDPRAGRFLSRDTIGLWGDAGSLGNGYTYARNNPHTFLDPMGESILRTIPCSGPWPGPASVTIEYEGCSSSRRATLDSPVCRAFRGSARAFADVQDVWLTDLTGTPIILSPTGASPSSTRQRLKKWFGGPDNVTSIGSKQTIASHLSEVFDALDANDVDIDCESCSDANAYVNWGGYDVNVCPPFFNSGFSTRKQAAILVHELTHAYADTDDYCYYPTDGVNLPWNLLFETTTLRENGDTYEQFVLEFYT
jgi:RHS repeat-associated protein